MAEPTVKSLREVRAEQIQKSSSESQRQLRMQKTAQLGKVRREASSLARRRDLPGYGRAFDVRVVKEREGIEKSIGEAFEAKEKEIEVAAKKAIGKSDVIGNVVTLLNGEYVDKGWFDELSQERKDFLLEQGLGKYKQRYFIKLKDDEYVDDSWFNELSQEKKDVLSGQGLEKFRQAYLVEIRPDEYLDKEWYESLPAFEQQSLKSQGLAKWQGVKTKEYLEGLPSVPATISQWVENTGKVYGAEDSWMKAEEEVGMSSAAKMAKDVIKVNLRDTWAGKYFDTPGGTFLEDVNAGGGYVMAAQAMGAIKVGQMPYEYPYAVDYVKLGTGEYIPLSFFANLPDDRKALMYKVGLDPKQALETVRNEVIAGMNDPIASYMDLGHEFTKVTVGAFGAAKTGTGTAAASGDMGMGQTIEGTRAYQILDKIPMGMKYLEGLVRQKVLPSIQRAYPNLSKDEIESMVSKERDYLANVARVTYNTGVEQWRYSAAIKDSIYDKELKNALDKNALGYFDVAKMLPNAKMSEKKYGTVADNLVNLISTFEQQANGQDMSKLGQTVQQIRTESKNLGNEITLKDDELVNVLRKAGIAENVYSPWFAESLVNKAIKNEVPPDVNVATFSHPVGDIKEAIFPHPVVP